MPSIDGMTVERNKHERRNKAAEKFRKRGKTLEFRTVVLESQECFFVYVFLIRVLRSRTWPKTALCIVKCVGKESMTRAAWSCGLNQTRLC
jgi:hypothetical protein